MSSVTPVLDATRKEREKIQRKLDELVTLPAAEKRSLTDEEALQFEDFAARLQKKTAEIRSLEKQSAREDKASAATADVPAVKREKASKDGEVEEHRSPAVVTSEPMTYSENPAGASYFRDLGIVAAGGLDQSYRGAADSASARMAQHEKEVRVEAERSPDLARRLREIRATPAGLEQRVNPNTSYGTGGEFVPPLWLIGQYAPLVRPGRVFANRVQNLPLPPGIDVINLPKITVGTLMGPQVANAAAVASRDFVTATVSAPVLTYAGQSDISLQLLEQSPIQIDAVIWDDLSRDYDQRVDNAIIAGTGAGGQHLGVLNVPGTTSNSNVMLSNYINVGSPVFFDGTTSGTQYRSIVNGVNQIETMRFAPPTAIWAHPRRVNSWSYAADGQNRPLFIPTKYGQFNTVGTYEVAPQFQGVAGELFGLPVVKDANMPTVMNGNTVVPGTPGADAVIVLKEDDLYFWEGTARMRALPEILSGTLQVRYQMYCYSAFMPNRFPVSLSILTGNTGLASPTF